jgi:branched-chain amino acid transport system substrate-binding protein
MATVRVGMLHDMSDAPPCPSDIQNWLQMVADEYVAGGRTDRRVEFVHGWGLGLPAGTAEAVERAFEDLVRQQPLLIIGPMIGDNAIIATPLADKFRVPTLNWAGSERARSDYMFHLQVGSHEDESVVIAHYLKAIGANRIGVLYDESAIGHGHLRYLRSEGAILDLTFSAALTLDPVTEQADDMVDQVIASNSDAIVYLGLGLSAPAVARRLTERGWDSPRIMNTAGLRGYWGDFGQIIDGWTYLDMHSDGNATLRDLRQRLNLPANQALRAAKGYDLGRLLAEAVARAPELSTEGLKDGLEQVKWLPAAEGEEGTLLGFGNFDRAALHGRYLVMRQWVGGQSVEVNWSAAA